MSHRVAFSPEALDDLSELYDYVAAGGGGAVALAYNGRVEAACRALATFPLRGVAREDIRPGLRVVGFERRAVIAFSVIGNVVMILRILHGGRELASSFTPSRTALERGC